MVKLRMSEPIKAVMKFYALSLVVTFTLILIIYIKYDSEHLISIIAVVFAFFTCGFIFSLYVEIKKKKNE
jgi:RsiW-degrading membrane proteinase PrsW (M82 family)